MSKAAMIPAPSFVANFPVQEYELPPELPEPADHEQFLSRVEDVQSGWNSDERQTRKQLGQARQRLLLHLICPPSN